MFKFWQSYINCGLLRKIYEAATNVHIDDGISLCYHNNITISYRLLSDVVVLDTLQTHRFVETIKNHDLVFDYHNNHNFKINHFINFTVTDKNSHSFSL